MSVGAVLFIVAGMIYSLDAFFPRRGLHLSAFIVWMVALFTLIYGEFLVGRAIQKVYRSSLLRIAWENPGSIHYLIGISVLVFCAAPVYLLEILRPTTEEFSWYSVLSVAIWAFCFANLALAARIHLHCLSGVKCEGEQREMFLLRDDIFAARAYGTLINTFLEAVNPVAKFFREALLEYFEYNPIPFEGCKLTQDGTMDIETVMRNIDRIHHENRIQEICTIFSTFISKLLELYGAVTSPKYAEEVLAKSYRATQEVYGDSPLFPRILRTMPEGFLEEEKLALLSKEGLEAKVRERTKDLEQALLKASEVNEALRASKASFHNIVERGTDGIIVLDREGIVRFVNPAAGSFFGRKARELIGESFNFPIVAGQSTEIDIIRQGGKKGVAELRIVETEWEGESAYLTLLRDITERERAVEQVKASLREKEVLLKEVNHRVKNNLQVISSMLNLQSRYSKDKQSLEIFKEIQNRVRSMALIHEKLYQSQHLTGIDCAEYIKTLANSLYWSYGADPSKIVLHIGVDDVSLGIDAAIPCGLIINELVSNSLKYAFPKGEGEIRISLRPTTEDEIRLVVSDNGVGIPKDLDFRTKEMFGLHLVTILAEDQLRGDIKLDRSKGTKFKITFMG